MLVLKVVMVISLSMSLVDYFSCFMQCSGGAGTFEGRVCVFSNENENIEMKPSL